MDGGWEGGAVVGRTAEATSDRERVLREIAHARRVSRLLMGLGWSVLVLAVVGVAWTAALWALDEISAEQTLALILGTLLASVLSGAGAYGAGVNVGLGAERLSLSLEPERFE